MYQRHCIASGCSKAFSGYSFYCSRHRKLKTRHGDVRQASISATRLAPYLKRIQARHKANIDSTAWDILARRWALLVAGCARTIEDHSAGFASVRHHVEAAKQVRTLDGLRDPMKVAHVVMAMYLMAEMEPHAFVSDQGFDYQVVRRVQSLAPVNLGSYWCQREKRMKGVYRDMAPRAVESLAEMLKDVFGLAGLQLARIEQRTEDPAEAERRRLEEAIEALR